MHSYSILGDGLTTTTSSSTGLIYELFVPRSPPPTEAVPVLIFLHGRGESGSFDTTNRQSLPLRLLEDTHFADTLPFLVVIPQCPESCALHNVWFVGGDHNSLA